MKVEFTQEIKESIKDIVKKLGLDYIDVERIVTMRSFGSTSKALARIWSLPKIWQKALNVDAHYIIEIISENFDNLNEDEKKKTLLHELLHVPHSFSGAVLSHRCTQFNGKGGHKIKVINKKTVDKLFKIYKNYKGR